MISFRKIIIFFIQVPLVPPHPETPRLTWRSSDHRQFMEYPRFMLNSWGRWDRSCLTIRTLHDCPSQMNENLLISNSKLTSDSELIWWRLSTNLSSFVRDSHVGCVSYNGNDNHYQIRSWIQIMRNVRVLSNHGRALLAHPCTFGEKIARFGISRF